ncbi:hypothetical protein DIJ62_17785 [Burkholderia pseudomallei]|nr:hypothetical protein [Burkholderia pseudomallei]QEW56184.1 hypothetical protein E4F38_21670 [Burkholderia pseudomallei]TOY80444.1 hypothetical protein DIJ62_17785 [Burkholderia pseudomallei]
MRGAARDRGSGDAARPASAARIESRATGGSCAIAPNRGDIRDADREGAWRKKRGGARLSSWKAGRLEGWKAGRLEGWKAGRRGTECVRLRRRTSWCIVTRGAARIIVAGDGSGPARRA